MQVQQRMICRTKAVVAWHVHQGAEYTLCESKGRAEGKGAVTPRARAADAPKKVHLPHKQLTCNHASHHTWRTRPAMRTGMLLQMDHSEREEGR